MESGTYKKSETRHKFVRPLALWSEAEGMKSGIEYPILINPCHNLTGLLIEKDKTIKQYILIMLSLYSQFGLIGF